jgi:hypothetical protein
MAVAIKTLMVLGTLLLWWGAGRGPTPGLLLVAVLLLVGIGYPLGDVFVLQSSGNAVTTALDAALSLGVLWAVAAAFPGALTAPGMWLVAAALTAGEWFYHRWLERTVGLRAHPREPDPQGEK